jgi:hypothetical protein
MTENYKLRMAILSAFHNILQRNFGILLILWCSFKLWWNFCLDLLSSKFWLIGEWSILLRNWVAKTFYNTVPEACRLHSQWRTFPNGQHTFEFGQMFENWNPKFGTKVVHFPVRNIHRGYYTAARRYDFYLRVVKTIFYTNERSEWVKYCF